MKDLIGALALFVGFVIIAQCCGSPRANGQVVCSRCDCPSYSYTETMFVNGRTLLCNIFVDSCGNVTRSCS